MTRAMTAKPSKVTPTAARAMRHSVTNIITRQPRNWAEALMMEGILLARACCRVLTSLVTRLRMSPWDTRLK